MQYFCMSDGSWPFQELGSYIMYQQIQKCLSALPIFREFRRNAEQSQDFNFKYPLMLKEEGGKNRWLVSSRRHTKIKDFKFTSHKMNLITEELDVA